MSTDKEGFPSALTEPANDVPLRIDFLPINSYENPIRDNTLDEAEHQVDLLDSISSNEDLAFSGPWPDQIGWDWAAFTQLSVPTSPRAE